MLATDHHALILLLLAALPLDLQLETAAIIAVTPDPVANLTAVAQLDCLPRNVYLALVIIEEDAADVVWVVQCGPVGERDDLHLAAVVLVTASFNYLDQLELVLYRLLPVHQDRLRGEHVLVAFY